MIRLIDRLKRLWNGFDEQLTEGLFFHVYFFIISHDKLENKD